MKTKFIKSIATLATISLFAPWASAQYTYTDDDATDVTITGTVAIGGVPVGAGTDLVQDINVGLALTAVDVAANGVDIATNGLAIGLNSTNIAGNATNILAVANTGATNAGNIVANATNISQNGSDIGITQVVVSDNISDIAQNATDIGTNDTDIAQNATDIGNNDTDIAQNATNIAQNATNIGTNDSDIAQNVTDIAQNVTDIAQNVTDIAQNATDIGNEVTRATAAEGVNASGIATNAADIARIDSYDTHAQNLTDLGALSIGDIPPAISNVVTDIEAYKAVEEGIKAGLDNDIAISEGNIATTQAGIDSDQGLADGTQSAIVAALTANPLADVTALEAQLAIHQANIATGNTNLATQQAQLSVEQADLATSEIKIALYDSALNPNTDPGAGVVGPIAQAQADAALAAAAVTQAVTDYTTVNSSAAGLEGIIADIDGVTAGDQTAVTTAIVNANTTFGVIGAAAATVQDIQTLVGVIDTELPNLPAISQADKDLAIQNVTDGAYERVAIADNAANAVVNATAIADETTRATAAEGANTTAIGVNATAIANETTRATAAEGVNATAISNEVADRDALINRQVDGIHIGANSFILDDTAGAHVLTTNDGSLTLGGGAVTTVDVDADLDVNGDIFTSGDVFVGGRTTGLQSQVDSNRADIDRNARGIAMAAALQHTTVLPGMKHALDLSAAHFEGETGLSINYARRINDNMQINFGAAATTDFDESVIKGGIGWQW
jgi:hypothetical protein